MKKLGLFLAILLTVAMALPTVAQEKAEQAPPTQLDLAKMLCELMGLNTAIGANPSAQQIFAALTSSGVRPLDGWKTDEPVTLGVLAQVLVMASGHAKDIKDPSDANAWVALAKELGFDLGEGVQRAMLGTDQGTMLGAGAFIKAPGSDPVSEQRMPAIPGESDDQAGLNVPGLNAPLSYGTVIAALNGLSPSPVLPTPVTQNQ